jgi:hypothetical protein
MTLKEAYEYIEKKTEFVDGYGHAIMEHMVTKNQARMAVRIALKK